MEVVSVADLFIGSKTFTDRVYTFTSVGNYKKSCWFIRGPNGDSHTASNLVQTSIDVPFLCTVYLDFWGGSDHLKQVSEWIEDWSESSTAMPTTFDQYGPGIVMERHFDAGVINLMGNNRLGTYYAFVCPQGILRV